MSEKTAAKLIASVENLSDEVKALRTDLGRRTRRLWIWVLGAIAVGAVGLTLVVVRLAMTVDDIRDQQRASCAVFADVGDPSLLTPESGRLAREIVKDAAEAARVLGCAETP
jgi:hypothetical protein